MKYYDYIFSLGRSCHTAIALKEINLKGESDVFDWSGGNLFDKCGVGGFEGKVNLICNNFENFLNIDDFEEFKHAPNDKHLNVRNKRTGLQYLHDFPKDKTIEEEFGHFKEKYERRISRLYKKLGEAETICFIFITWEEYLTNEIILKAENILNEKFDNKIDILVLQNDTSLENGEYYKELLSNKSTRIHFNNLCVPIDSGGYNYKIYQKIINNELISKYKLEYFDKQKKLCDYAEFISYFKEQLSDLDILKFSPLFDENWYKNMYLLNSEEKDCAMEYLNNGWKFGNNPSLNFDGNQYLSHNKDVADSKMNPLIHYLRYGIHEKRRIFKVKK